MVRQIGEGGMGAVYEARREGLDQRVAVKVLRGGPPTATQRARFEREAQVVSRLTHPHTVRLFDYGVLADESPYLVFEYLGGEGLDRLIAELPDGRMEPRRAVRLASQLCGALAEAHAHGVIHRDLKPGNVMVSQVEGEDFARLVDFGIAAVDAETLTQSGAIIGTALYMAPEQVCGDPVGPGCDLYALGVMLFELLRGARPFTFTNRTECMAAHLHQPPRPLNPTEGPARFSPALTALVAMLLIKDPAERPTDATLVRDLLRACPEYGLGPPSSASLASAVTATADSDVTYGELTARRSTSTERASSGRRARRVALGLTGLLLALGTIWALRSNPSNRESDTPSTPSARSEAPPRSDRTPTSASETLPPGVWQAFLNADFDVIARAAESARLRGRLTERLRLLRVMALVVENSDTVGAVVEATRAAVADSTGHSARLIRLAAEVSRREARSREALEQFIRAHPDDPIARILACNYDLVSGEPHCDHLATLLPGSVIAALVRGLHASRTARWGETRRVVDAALRASPSTPSLLLLRAESFVFLGDFERARAALTDYLQREPGSKMARRRLLTVLISQGDEVQVARALQRLNDDTVSPDFRVEMLYEAGRDHVGLGHATKGFAHLEAATRFASEALRFDAVLKLCGMRFAAALLLADEARMVEALRCRRAAAGELEVPPTDRKRAQVANIINEGWLAFHRKQIDGVRRAVRRLREHDAEHASMDALRARLAALEGDVDGAEAHLAKGIDRCGTHYNALSVWFHTGQRDRALRAGERLLASECVMFGTDRVRAANGRLMLAELLIDDDPAAARQHLAAWRALWPAPEPTLPASQRARRLTERVAVQPR